MFLTQGQPERGKLTPFRYGTAGTTTTTSLASQGGLLINIDSATGDIAQTGSGWIEDEKYGFNAREFATSTSAEFDTAVTRTGSKTLKMSTLDATGIIRVLPQAANNYSTVATNLANSAKFIPVKPSTKYRFSVYGKGNNLVAGTITLQELSSSGSGTAAPVTNSLSGTVDWTLQTVTFTTNASSAFIGFLIGITSAGNISDYWVDVNSMTLEEVIEPVANSLTTPSPSLVSFTAVGSTDNIDQSQLTQNDARGVGGDGSTSTITNKMAQQFLPSKSKLTGVIIRKVADIGTFTGTITAKIVNDNAGTIGTTTIASITLSNATYQAIANDTDYILNLPCNLTVGTLYWLTIEASTSDALNYARFRLNSGNPYTSGICQTFYSGAWNTVAFDFYFKTLYYKPTTNFKASQNNLTVSVSADEDGFLNGSVVNFLTGTATFTETFGTFYLLQYTISGSDLIAEINLPGVGLSGSFTSDRTLEYSNDGVTYGSTFPTGFAKVWVKILAYSGFASFSYSIQFSTSGISVLKNYPTNKDIIKQYATTLGAPTTSATYRATKWGFPAIEYSSTEYQYLDVDTTATGSTVAFSELGTTYTTVADGASLAISSTSTPNLFVKVNITANRLYSSSNDYNASSEKDGSLKQTITYQVVQ